MHMLVHSIYFANNSIIIIINYYACLCLHTSMCFVLAIPASKSKLARAEIVTDVSRVNSALASILTKISPVLFLELAANVLSTVLPKPIACTAVFMRRGREGRGEKKINSTFTYPAGMAY